MAFVIEDVRKAKPKEGARYLFDANIWLAILETTFSNMWMKPYEDFFNAVFGKTGVKSCSIVIPSALLSEVFYRFMHDIFYAEFLKTNPIPAGMKKHEHYKNVYRASGRYAADFENVGASIRAYHSNVQLLSDKLDELTFKQLTKKIPIHLDFNDHLYFQIAKHQNLIVVTNDGDFYVEDVQIITRKPELLKLIPSSK